MFSFMKNTSVNSPGLPAASSSARLGAFLKKRKLRLPIWLWITFALAGVFSAASSSSDEASSGKERELSSTTTIRSFRFKESDDPIKNLLYQAEQSQPSLNGWLRIDEVFTDDDMLYDDIRLDVSSDLDYQDENDAISMIDVALAIQAKAQSPVQIDIRIDVMHSELQPDGSITEEKIRREWIEVTGDSKGAAVIIDVYGYLPAQEVLLQTLKDGLSAKYPDATVKITDTSSFDS